MPGYVWLTDLHLNFLERPRALTFLEQLAEYRPEGVWFTGDLAEAPDVANYLRELDERLDCPLYFVLGNHDYYFGSIADVRSRVLGLCSERPKLHYLTAESGLSLADGRAILGHDGWADAQLGDYGRSYVMMNDYKLIQELAGYSKGARWPVLQAMGQEAAQHIRRWLPGACEKHSEVILLTHVPPLREACWYDGRISDDEWAPHFTCKAVGDAILQIMPDYPACRLKVLCGHTHGGGHVRPLANVEVLTGAAQYGAPRVARIFR